MRLTFKHRGRGKRRAKEFASRFTRPSGMRIQKGIRDFCRTMAGPEAGRYRYSYGCPETRWASAFSALVLAMLDGFEELAPGVRQPWIDYLQQAQDPVSGLFIDPLYREADKPDAKYSTELLHAHASTFIMGALHILGARPRFPIFWVHPLRRADAMLRFIETRPWHVTPWMTGNWLYDIACAMGADYQITGDSRNLQAMDAFFDWSERNQDPQTGWWDPANSGTLETRIYGGYHLLMAYQMFDRPLAKTQQMVDTVLSIQRPDGFFAPDGGGCCQDMDAVDTLVSICEVSAYRYDDVTRALKSVLGGLLGKQEDDGGFMDRKDARRTEYSWKLCRSPRGASDLCSTLFQAFSISRIASFLDDRHLLNAPWRHHQHYCHCLVKPLDIH